MRVAGFDLVASSDRIGQHKTAKHREVPLQAASEVRAALCELTHTLNTLDSVDVIATRPDLAEATRDVLNAPNCTRR